MCGGLNPFSSGRVVFLRNKGCSTLSAPLFPLRRERGNSDKGRRQRGRNETGVGYGWLEEETVGLRTTVPLVGRTYRVLTPERGLLCSCSTRGTDGERLRWEWKWWDDRGLGTFSGGGPKRSLRVFERTETSLQNYVVCKYSDQGLDVSCPYSLRRTVTYPRRVVTVPRSPLPLSPPSDLPPIV